MLHAADAPAYLHLLHAIWGFYGSYHTHCNTTNFDSNNRMNPINFNQNFGSSSQIKPFVSVSGGISGGSGGAGYGGQVSAGIHSNRGYVGVYGSGGGSFGGGFGGGAIGIGGGFRF
jgi:hypothetical protein